MTSLGKVLAFLNLIGAIGILTWSISAYVNRVDYLDTKTETDTVKGQISQMREEIDGQAKAISDSQSLYGRRINEVLRLQEVRDFRQSRFDQRVAQARKGQFRVQVPIAIKGQENFTDLEKEGPIEMGPNNLPLRGIDATQAELDTEVRTANILLRGEQPVPEAIWQQVPAIVLNPQEFARFQQSLGIGDLRRLHGLLSDLIARTDEATLRQQVIAANLREEARFLDDHRVNWTAELQTLERRQRQIEGRLASLGVELNGK